MPSFLIPAIITRLDSIHFSTHTHSLACSACVYLSAYWRSSCYSHRGVIVHSMRLITKTLLRGFNFQSLTEEQRWREERGEEGGRGRGRAEVSRGGRRKRRVKKKSWTSKSWPSSAKPRSHFEHSAPHVELLVAELWERVDAAWKDGRGARMCVWLFEHRAALTGCRPQVTLSK